MNSGLNRALLRALCLIVFANIFFAVDAAANTTPAPVQAPAPPAFGTVRYFFTVDLDPRYQIVGTGALTEDAAARANCYRFTYDTNGRVERIEYQRAGFAAEDPFFQVSRIDFEYLPGLERRWYRNDHGQPIKSVYDIFGEELALDGAGYPVSVTNLDASGGHMVDASGVTTYQRTLDQHNRLVSARRTRIFSINITDANGLFETRTVYDTQGRRMEYGNYDSSGTPLNDADGVALTRTTYTLYPDSIAQIESYFDASGLACVEKSSGVHQRQRTFDQRGFVLSEAFFDVSGAPCLDNKLMVHEHRYEYDDRGERISESFFDIDGKPKNQQTSGWARQVYQYDNRNRVITKSFFGDDGAPQVLQNLGAAIIRQEYDDQGNISRRQFFDGQGNPSNHVQYGAPAIRIKVDGENTIVTLRDAHDELMQNYVTGYAGFSYNTLTDHPLSHKNHFFDRKGRTISRLRVFIINPHLHALRSNLVMSLSARCGAAASGLGALMAMFIALRKASFTRRQKVYVPMPWERFIGWLSMFLIGEGLIRFLITIWWAYVGYQDGHMGYGVYLFETLYIIFFIYRLIRMHFTMRVLNISRADIHGIIREFFSKADIAVEWNEQRQMFLTQNLDLRVRYFPKKSHAYLAFHVRDAAGNDLARGLVAHIRSEAGTLESFPHTRAIALYYPSVALCYFLLAFTAFYTLWQVVKKY